MNDQKSLGIILIVFAIFLIIIVSSLKVNLDEQGAFLCEIVESDPTLDMEECPAHKNNSPSWLIMIAFGISFLIFASGIYLTTVQKKSKKKVDLSNLNEDEQKLIGLIKENEGSMYQSDLIKELDISKVQLTRILDKLENKKVIERKRRGMANLVVLK
ncbi:MarR family transcriptional regulator [Candidatus Woesearchaeota archaeon]|jgi:uncharacterized membrane protein|nr:MarR family transcriptional regulator [Candidatus Woesearchaeota archaeon]MBT6044795.1 MarR family transcriptional regulator [Candidatus Woesearchaeota archaeon]